MVQRQAVSLLQQFKEGRGRIMRPVMLQETTSGCGGMCLPWLPFAAAYKTSGSS